MGQRATKEEELPPDPASFREKAEAAVLVPTLPVELWDTIAMGLAPADFAHFMQVNQQLRAVGERIVDRMIDLHYRSPLTQRAPYAFVQRVRDAYPALNATRLYALCGMVTRAGVYLVYATLGNARMRFHFGRVAIVATLFPDNGQAGTRTNAQATSIPAVIPAQRGHTSLHRDLARATHPIHGRVPNGEEPRISAELEGEEHIGFVHNIVRGPGTPVRLIYQPATGKHAIFAEDRMPVARVQFAEEAGHTVTRFERYDLEGALIVARQRLGERYDLMIQLLPSIRQHWVGRPMVENMGRWAHLYWLLTGDARNPLGTETNGATIRLSEDEIDTFLPQGRGPPLLRACVHSAEETTHVNLETRQLLCDICLSSSSQ